MISTTTMSVEGHQIVACKGLVEGMVIRKTTWVQGFWGLLRNIIGRQMASLDSVCRQTRQEAHQLMIEKASQLGGNAVIGVRYMSVPVGHYFLTEVVCYGTAVIIEKSS